MFIVSTSWQTKSINIQQRDKGHLSFPWAAHIQVFSFMTLKGYWLAGIVFACGSIISIVSKDTGRDSQTDFNVNSRPVAFAKKSGNAVWLENRRKRSRKKKVSHT